MKIKSLLLALLIAITSLFAACEDDEQEVDEPVAGEQMADMGSDCSDVEEEVTEEEEEVAAGEEEVVEEEEESLLPSLSLVSTILIISLISFIRKKKL